MSNIRGFKEVSKKLSNIQDKLARKITRRGAAKFAQIVRKNMRRNAPKRSGTLKKNLKYKVKPIRGGGFTAHIGAFDDGFYGKFIEKGTKKHELTSKKNRFISVNGQPRANVIHPGQSAKPFIKKSFEQAEKQALKEAGQLMFKLIAQI